MSGTDTARRATARRYDFPAAGQEPRAAHPGLAVATGAMAGAAYAGAIGLLGGGLQLTPAIEARLPWHSLPLAGAALLVAVALPMTGAAWSAWRGHPRSADAAIVAGGLLMGWIGVEIAFIHAYSWMQPVCAGYGLFVAALGWRARWTEHSLQHRC